MSKGLFITGTDTDIGKTYVTALIVKTMRQAGYNAGYYKAAISGAPTVAASDAGFVNKFADIHEPEDMILPISTSMPYRPIWQQSWKAIPWKKK